MKPSISPTALLSLFGWVLWAVTLQWSPGVVCADSVAPALSDNSVQSELKSFEVLDGFQVNLFASEENGIANPITTRWDPQGRLWALCTWAYPQKKPGVIPNDKILILTDTDGDGRADKTDTYVDGLNMPMGFTFGAGGVYVGEGTRILHFRDTNGDGKADTRQIVFTGFGTDDTHQNVNSFTWSPGGELMFTSGNNATARIETADGVIAAAHGTVWRYRPRTRKLQYFMQNNTLGGNPWGFFFDRWGEMFVKSNNPQLVYAQPGMIATEHFRDMLKGGSKSCVTARSRGKSMIVEGIENSHLPEKYQGQLLIAGYYVHNIDRFKLIQEGAGYRTEKLPDLISTKHRSFRPVDIKTGPDGAIYIADWYNPIIGHYQADLHHPHRDKRHGRIWRVTAKGRPLLKRPVLQGEPYSVLLEHLKSKEIYVRRQVKRMLFDAETAPLITALDKWVAELDQNDPDYEHHLYEAIGLYESHETPRLALLQRLLAAEHAGARAYGTRVIGRWAPYMEAEDDSQRMATALSLLGKRVRDKNARVRMEAVVASAAIRSPQSIVLAVQALDMPHTRFIDHALIQAAHSLKPLWEPALATGKLEFERSSHLAFVLQEAGGRKAVPSALAMLENSQLAEKSRGALLAMVGELGTSRNGELALRQAGTNSHLLQQVLPALDFAWRMRKTKPQGEAPAMIHRIIQAEDLAPEIRAQAVRLGGAWGIQSTWKFAEQVATTDSSNPTLRVAAIEAMFALNASKAAGLADRLALQSDPSGSASSEVIAGLLRHDRQAASKKLVQCLANAKGAAQVAALVHPYLQRKAGAEELASALNQVTLSATAKSEILSQLSIRGLANPKLRRMLGSESAKTFKTPAHSPDIVQQLIREVRQSGDAQRGKIIFRSKVLGCVSCHESGDAAAEPVGPDLSAIGAGMPVSRLLESVLWPAREVKEGYDMTTLSMDDGRVYSGYVRTETDRVIHLFDIASRKMLTLPATAVEERKGGSSAMPEDLANVLTKQQLSDLILYLATRRGSK